MKWVHFPLFERTFIFFHLEVKFSYRVTVTVCSGALNSVTTFTLTPTRPRFLWRSANMAEPLTSP